jgi:hypothetical protein
MTMAEAYELLDFWRECPPHGTFPGGVAPARIAQRPSRADLEALVAQHGRG